MRIEKFFHSLPLRLQKTARMRPKYVFVVEIGKTNSRRIGSSYGKTPQEATRKARVRYSMNTAKRSRQFKQLKKKIRQSR